MPRDHRRLDAFQLADQLALAIYRLTVDLPSTERFGIQSQLRRAALSIPTNIVEGCARDSQGDLKRFLDIAFGSAREILYLISIATRLGFIEAREAREVVTLGDRVAGAVLNLRRSLQ